MLQLVISRSAVRECDAVVRRKAAGSLPLLAQLLEAATIQTSDVPTQKSIAAARAYVRHDGDARILAEAILAKPDWFVTHDEEHFLELRGAVKNPRGRALTESLGVARTQ